MDTGDRLALNHGFQEYQAVVTVTPLTGWINDLAIPAGSTGVIVDISPTAPVFQVEFCDPMEVASTTAEHIRPLPHDPSANPPLHELDQVCTLVDVIEDGERLPAGSTGTIVDVSRVPGWYEVEFTEPFQAVVTLTNVQVASLAA